MNRVNKRYLPFRWVTLYDTAEFRMGCDRLRGSVQSRLVPFPRVTEDFKAQLSEIRKNCKNLNGEGDGGGEGTKEEGGERGADLEGKLQALTVAYNDIQVGVGHIHMNTS